MSEKDQHTDVTNIPDAAKEKLVALAIEVIVETRAEFADLDGGWLQDRMEALGILQQVPVEEPCGEDCRCVEYGLTFPTFCLRLAPDVIAVMRRFSIETDST